MAITRVIQPQRPEDPLSKVSKVAQIAGTVGTLAGQPWGPPVAAAGSLGGQVSQQPPQVQSVDPVDVQSAISRRQQTSDPYQYINEATLAIDELDIPNDQKLRLKQPLLLAQERGRIA